MEVCPPAGPGTLGCLLFAQVLEAAGHPEGCRLVQSHRQLPRCLVMSQRGPPLHSLTVLRVFSVSVAPG